MGKPRQTYYIFAHKALPSVFFEKPGDVIAALDHTGTRMPVDLWKFVSERVSESFPPDGFTCEVRRTEDGTAIGLLTLPEPQEMTECYHVALVFALGGPTRYLTCELTQPPVGPEAGQNHAVLCEWTGTSHANYGRIASAGPEDFYQRVIGMLKPPPPE